MDEVEISENCERCGKPIAAMVKGQALCCGCRYGERSWKDEFDPEDCVDHFGRPEQERLEWLEREMADEEDEIAELE